MALGVGEFAASIGTFSSLKLCVDRYETLTSELPGTFNYDTDDGIRSLGNIISEGTAWLYA